MTETKRNRGFTLAELIIVLVVIGVLIVLALPIFTSIVMNEKEVEAVTTLKYIFNLEKAYYNSNKKYESNLTELSDWNDPQAEYYHFAIISADNDSEPKEFVAIAIPNSKGRIARLRAFTIDQDGNIRVAKKY